MRIIRLLVAMAIQPLPMATDSVDSLDGNETVQSLLVSQELKWTQWRMLYTCVRVYVCMCV